MPDNSFEGYAPDTSLTRKQRRFAGRRYETVAVVKKPIGDRIVLFCRESYLARSAVERLRFESSAAVVIHGPIEGTGKEAEMARWAPGILIVLVALQLTRPSIPAKPAAGEPAIGDSQEPGSWRIALQVTCRRGGWISS